MRSFEIKPVGNDDFHRWLPLWESYQRFYEVDIPEPVTRETWARFLDPSEPMHAALATAGEQTYGLVHSIYHRSTWTTGDYCYLQDLFVTADARGGGIERALIEYVCAAAKQRGVSRVHWLTHETNRVGMRLYDSVADKSGFIQYRKSIA
ncbi:GNAT family N-acetyltransferase [Caballeronia sp. LZ035]|uniref:GNAT family N-acetyltransferase n=1 Tax=Caballeronia sp. LZ035 TaxID=3038568 RepID=UPI00285B75C1|nr:GNAT family N-acetyltransferase [Caballeronia sp. LZ035]MDR5759492.1 GNAT family N-acetyltransferase [Caballeronia sp. LZ035]